MKANNTNTVIIFLSLFISVFSIAQNENTKISLFSPGSNITFLDIKQMEINTPNGGSDIRNYRVKLENKENNFYSCQIIEISTSAPKIYSDSLLKTIKINFKIDPKSNKLLVISNLDSISKIFKTDWEKKNYNKTNSFSFFDYSSLLMEMHFSGYLEIIKDFLNSNLNTLRHEIEIPNVSDSIPAIQLDQINKDKNKILIKRNIIIDTNTVLNYLYKKNILDKYENFDEATRKSIYSSTSQQDFNRFINHKYLIDIIGRKYGEFYIIEQINYEFSYNLGNDFDRYIIYYISRIEF